jgi:hypothetical protein
MVDALCTENLSIDTQLGAVRHFVGILSSIGVEWAHEWITGRVLDIIQHPVFFI